MPYLADVDWQPLQLWIFCLQRRHILCDIILQCLGILGHVDVFAIVVVVHVDEIVAALVAALFDKVFEVIEAGGSAPVGDGWCAELHLAPKGLDEALVHCYAVCDVQVGLTGVVGLVGSI